MKKSLIVTFWVLIGVFLVVLAELLIPMVRELFKSSFLFLLPLIIFSLLGALLICLTIREKVEGRLKKFLLLTGASALGFFVFVFLHNAFYALGEITSHIPALSSLMEILHAVSFIIAVFICPLGFLVGIVGTIRLLIRRRV